MQVGFYRSSKAGVISKMIRTKLKKDDVIGYDVSQISKQSIKIFRPAKGTLYTLHVKVRPNLSKNFRWPLDKEGFELLAYLMAFSAGHKGVIQIHPKSDLGLTWAYQVY